MILAADFETTTDPADCRVWAWGAAEIGNPLYFRHGTDLDTFMHFCLLADNPVIYFHNLKFDGEFIIVWLFENGYTWVKGQDNMETRTFTTLISDKGMFYSLEVCFRRAGRKVRKATFFDSLKVLPFTVDKIARDFKLPMAKLEMDYKEKRPPGHQLTDGELAYLKNDVLIMSMALNILFGQGLTKMTVGSNALADYKEKAGGEKKFRKQFPLPGYDSDVRKSYRGGFTYANPVFQEKDIGEGIVLDVNSLYPSVMHDCLLPYGEGIFYKGRYVQDDLYPLYVQRLKCQFEVKDGRIPTIQLKKNLSFVPTEYVRSSGDKEVIMTLTSVDLDLFFQQYDVYNAEWLDGWMFKAAYGMFDGYIDQWFKVKVEAEKTKNGALRTIAKLMLNNLYGKFATNPEVGSKMPVLDEGRVRYVDQEKEWKDPVYIPVGTFITAWARYKTITSAQKVYGRFLYADTDSLHLIGMDLPEELDVHPTRLGAWKWESAFRRARFIRAKTYIEDEYVLEDDGTIRRDLPTELKVTCAGMPSKCYESVTWENFHPGSSYGGKLLHTHVKGGVVLQPIDFTIKK